MHLSAHQEYSKVNVSILRKCDEMNKPMLPQSDEMNFFAR